MKHDELRAANGECECQECCEHGDMDGGYCLDCGKDRTEELMSRAYDYYKDKMKYGE